MSDKKVAWFQGLGFKWTIAFVVMAVGMLSSAIWVVNTTGKNRVLKESAKLIEQTGNNAVENLIGRSSEIAGLVRTIATLTEKLPQDPSVYRRIYPAIYDFDGDLKVAGGGVWPEPYQFSKGVERRSFFWGRDKNGLFKYYDDYNDPAGNGYHHEEWYVVVRHIAPGRCFWSKSYMDPYSFQPMVTCTVGTYDQKKMTGTVTVDLKLEGIEGSMRELQNKTGGYAVLFDRNGKFIAFPEAGDRAKILSTDPDGNQSGEFLTATEFAEKQPLFKAISNEVKEMNQYILEKARSMPGYDAALPAKIDQDSYQINREEAEFISAVVVDPLKESTRKSKLFKTFEIENDFILGEKSLVFLFHVPESYWKFAIVKPLSEATTVASSLVRSLALKLGTLILILTSLGYWMLRRFVVKPITDVTQSVQYVDGMIGEGRFQEIKKHHIRTTSKDEIGVLASIFENLSQGFVESRELIEKQNKELELKVEERTKKVTEVGYELKKSQRFLETLISNLNGMVYRCRNDSNWTVEFVNEGCFDLTGYTPGDFMLSRNVSFGNDVIHPDDQEKVWGEVQEALQKREAFQINYRILTADKELKWVWEQGRGVFAEDGGLDALEGIIVDISKHKESENQLAYYTSELKRSNQDLEEFAYIASHDLQEPLRKIISFGDRLKDKSSSLDEGGKEYLERMQNAASRMQKFIDDLLQYSRVSNTQNSIKPVDLNKIIEQVADNLGWRLRKVGGMIQVDSLPVVEGDPVHLSILFQNLISNAIKYHKKDVAPVVSVRSSFCENTQRWDIAVSDNGIGIDDKYFERIFKPFERLHGRGDFEGTGIGLAICEKIVTRHYGEITVRSHLEKGATFIVSLPKDQPDKS
ncbi:MAG: ATP-binding protein [Nitrospinota bacterium]|nr:ATP-binding protein [Nitrospinota bacterium]